MKIVKIVSLLPALTVIVLNTITVVFGYAIYFTNGGLIKWV